MRQIPAVSLISFSIILMSFFTDFLLTLKIPGVFSEELHSESVVTNKREEIETKTSPIVQLLRFHNSVTVNKYKLGAAYTPVSWQQAPTNFRFSGNVGQCYLYPAPGTVPIYEFTYGAQYSLYLGVVCYVYSNPTDNTVETWEFLNPQTSSQYFSQSRGPTDGDDGAALNSLAWYMFAPGPCQCCANSNVCHN